MKKELASRHSAISLNQNIIQKIKTLRSWPKSASTALLDPYSTYYANLSQAL